MTEEPPQKIVAIREMPMATTSAVPASAKVHLQAKVTLSPLSRCLYFNFCHCHRPPDAQMGTAVGWQLCDH